jgi:hypothetical protein
MGLLVDEDELSPIDDEIGSVFFLLHLSKVNFHEFFELNH